MAISYTWTIQNMSCHTKAEGEAYVVFSVFWVCDATDGTHSSNRGSIAQVTYTASTPFIAYADLTQEEVLNWVWDGGVSKNDTEASLAEAIAATIENEINPPVSNLPLPWLPAELPVANTPVPIL